MADRKPIVLIDGKLSQLPPGDTLAGMVTEVDIVEMVAKEALSAGAVVACSAGNEVERALNSDAAKAEAIGVAMTAAALDAPVKVQSEGYFELADWTNIAGSAQLAAAADYYLDAAAGKITSVPPTAGHLVRIGRAVKPTVLQLRIDSPIRLY